VRVGARLGCGISNLKRGMNFEDEFELRGKLSRSVERKKSV